MRETGVNRAGAARRNATRASVRVNSNKPVSPRRDRTGSGQRGSARRKRRALLERPARNPVLRSFGVVLGCDFNRQSLHGLGALKANQTSAGRQVRRAYLDEASGHLVAAAFHHLATIGGMIDSSTVVRAIGLLTAQTKKARVLQPTMLCREQPEDCHEQSEGLAKESHVPKRAFRQPIVNLGRHARRSATIDPASNRRSLHSNSSSSAPSVAPHFMGGSRSYRCAISTTRKHFRFPLVADKVRGLGAPSSALTSAHPERALNRAAPAITRHNVE